jgi:hypothetical protein
VEENGVLKAQKLAFDGTVASDHGSPEDIGTVGIFATNREEPAYKGSGEENSGNGTFLCKYDANTMALWSFDDVENGLTSKGQVPNLSLLNGNTSGNNTIQISDNKAKFGTRSLYVPEGSYAYFKNPLVDLSKSFTVDFWLYMNKAPYVFSPLFLTSPPPPAGNNDFFYHFYIWENSGDWLIHNGNYGGEANLSSLGQASSYIGGWHHFALVREYNYADNIYRSRVAIDGVFASEYVQYDNWGSGGGYTSLTDCYCSLCISLGSEQGECYLDEVRISNTVRWSENFTPPSSPYAEENK